MIREGYFSKSLNYMDLSSLEIIMITPISTIIFSDMNCAHKVGRSQPVSITTLSWIGVRGHYRSLHN